MLPKLREQTENCQRTIVKLYQIFQASIRGIAQNQTTYFTSAKREKYAENSCEQQEEVLEDTKLFYWDKI